MFYGVSIKCQYGNKYPWEIKIDNFYAPGLQGPKGGLTPKTDEISGAEKSLIRLNDMEWSQFVFRLDSNIKHFESSVYGYLYKEAIAIDKAHRDASKAAAEGDIANKHEVA